MDLDKALIIDTETTGLKNPELIEYGSTECKFIEGQITASYPIHVQRYKPNSTIEYGAMATHGITMNCLEFAPSVNEFAAPSVNYLIGHNIDFDWKVIGSPPCQRICTLALARSIWPEESHKLLALMFMLYPEKAKNWHKSAHGVATDIEMTFFLLRVILEKLQISNLNELYIASEAARIPKVMPFGKHINTPISNVPLDYIQWCLRSLTDLDPYLKQALEDRIY